MKLSPQLSSNLSLEEFLKLPEKYVWKYCHLAIVYQKPQSKAEQSTITSFLVTNINKISQPQKLAYAFPELRYTFSGRSLVPDIAVFEWSRIPLLPNGRIANQFEISPDLTIEILSPKQSPNRVIRNIMFSIENGTKLGLFLDSEDE